jgi:hypothetical protein
VKRRHAPYLCRACSLQEDAAHAYDLAALACKGLDAQINFTPDSYADQLREIAGFSRVGGRLGAGRGCRRSAALLKTATTGTLLPLEGGQQPWSSCTTFSPD